MEEHPAIEAIVLFALRTLKFGISIFKDKCKLAVGCWTPRGVRSFLHRLVEGKIVILIQLIIVQDMLDVLNVQLCLAPYTRALEREPTILHLIPQVSLEALHVKVADTPLEREKLILLVKVFIANLAKHVVCFRLFLLPSQLSQTFFIFLLHLSNHFHVQLLLFQVLLLVELLLYHFLLFLFDLFLIKGYLHQICLLAFQELAIQVALVESEVLHDLCVLLLLSVRELLRAFRDFLQALSEVSVL
mmetsp:Transcript_5038/g.4608  ORF Transcript_5038/g.4608 Transcript_5038/m.4608 type:complete len:245 (-) Transcript_5038:539-1273(-)